MYENITRTHTGKQLDYEQRSVAIRIFSNGLTGEQKARFDDLLRTDADFKKQFEFEHNLKRAIKNKENESIKEKLAVFERDISSNIVKSSQDVSSVDSSSIDKSNRSPWKSWSIAASIALLIGLGWFGYRTFSGTDYEGLYDMNYETYPNTVYTITRSDSRASLERDAFMAYEKGEHESAIALFNDLSREGQGEDYIDFFLGQSYLNLDRNDDAIEKFRKTIDSVSEFVAEAHWYLALAYLKNGNSAAAMEQLGILMENYDFNRAKAEILIRELE